MVVCGRHHLWQPCLNLAHTPHGRLIDGQGRRPVRRPITAIHRLAGGTKAFEIPLGFRCEPVKHALVDITHLLSTESHELAKTAHACAQAKGACPHTRRGGGRVGGRDGTERPATSLPAGLLPPAAPHTPTPPHHAPAAAVERLGKARCRAPFVYPATVRGWVSRRIGPLVLGAAVVREQKQEPGP